MPDVRVLAPSPVDGWITERFAARATGRRLAIHIAHHMPDGITRASAGRLRQIAGLRGATPQRGAR